MRHPLFDVGLLILRLPLGIYFAIAGYNKIVGGVGTFVSGTASDIPAWLPAGLGQAYLWALPLVELIAGLALVLGIFSRLQAVLMLLMLCSFILAVTPPDFYVAGLIGQAGRPPYHGNLNYLGFALAIAVLGGGRFAVDRLVLEQRKRKD